MQQGVASLDDLAMEEEAEGVDSSGRAVRVDEYGLPVDDDGLVGVDGARGFGCLSWDLLPWCAPALSPGGAVAGAGARGLAEPLLATGWSALSSGLLTGSSERGSGRGIVESLP